MTLRGFFRRSLAILQIPFLASVGRKQIEQIVEISGQYLRGHWPELLFDACNS